jgi:5-(carboxyamino)imidazole ribonucleotide mutase
VAILMGSKNDLDVMAPAADVLDELGVGSEVRVLSAHRTPDRLRDFVLAAEGKGIRVFVCGAGGAAHLAGVVAAHTPLPVLAVPIASSPLGGLDALLAMAQMPGGVPVGTLAIGPGGARNAGLLAASILSLSDPSLRRALDAYRRRQADAIPDEPLR